MYIFSPLQLEEFGDSFYQGEGFSYRYTLHTRLGGLWKSVFIPFGPVAYTQEGFVHFLDHITSQKINKIMIPLPIILDEEIVDFVGQTLHRYGFRKGAYQVFEDETLLTIRDMYKLSRKTRYKVRKSQQNCKIDLTLNPDMKTLKKIYDFYIKTSEELGYKTRDFGAFKAFSQNSLLMIAQCRQTHATIGFILGYIFDIPVGGFLENQKTAKIAQIWFSRVNQLGRKKLAGYGLRAHFIDYTFGKLDASIVDAVGASRQQGKSYVAFKKEFATQFYSLPGRYTRFKLF